MLNIFWLKNKYPSLSDLKKNLLFWKEELKNAEIAYENYCKNAKTDDVGGIGEVYAIQEAEESISRLEFEIQIRENPAKEVIKDFNKFMS